MLSSPFTSKFRTNYSAEEEEIATIASILAETSLRLNALHDEIATLQHALNKLIQERDALQEYADEHRAFFAPIRRLPRDILEEIFIGCLPTHRNSVMSATEVPVLLGRICSAWRAISLSMPLLWSRVHIVEPASSDSRIDALAAIFHQKMAQRLEATEMWLHRSNPRPLSISVQFAARPYTLNPNIAPSPIIQALVPHASRWQNITFMAPPVLPELSDVDVPLLESLTLHHWHAFFGAGSYSLFRAPRLANVRFGGGNFVPLEIPLRWNHLPELSFQFGSYIPSMISVHAAIRILALCRVLRVFRLSVNDEGEEHPDDRDAPVLVHPHLQTLDVDCGLLLLFTLTQVCRRLVLPNLRTLLIKGRSTEQDNVSDIPFPTFLTNSPELERVQVRVSMFTQTSLMAFIRSLPQSTRQLEIFSTSGSWNPSHTNIDQQILLLLAPLPHSSAFEILCPMLEELCLYYCTSFSDEDLRDFVVTRMADGASASLRRIVVKFKRRQGLDILPDLQPLIDDGLKVDLEYVSEESRLEVPRFSPWDGLEDGPYNI